MDCPNLLAWLNVAARLIEFKKNSAKWSDRVRRPVPGPLPTPPAMSLGPPQAKIRSDVMFKDFEDKFDPTRIQCMHKSAPGECRVDIVFFHSQGMASMVGVGLPFGVVQVGSDRSRITVVEWGEEEWKALWVGTHPDAPHFIPLVIEHLDGMPQGTFSGWRNLEMVETGTLSAVGQVPGEESGDAPEGQEHLSASADSNASVTPGTKGSSKGSNPVAGEAKCVGAGSGVAQGASSKSSAPTPSPPALTYTVEVLFLPVNGQDSSQQQLIMTPPPGPAQQHRAGLVSRGRNWIKKVGFPRSSSSGSRLDQVSTGTHAESRPGDPVSGRVSDVQPAPASRFERMHHEDPSILDSIHECYIRPIFSVTFCAGKPGDQLKFQVRVGGEFQIPDDAIQFGCAHDNLRVSLEAPGQAAIRRGLPRPDPSLIEEFREGSVRGNTRTTSGSGTGGLTAGFLGTQVSGSVTGGTQNATSESTETPGLAEDRLKGSNFFVRGASAGTKSAVKASHRPAFLDVSDSTAWKAWNSKLDSRELIFLVDYAASAAKEDHQYEYKLELNRDMYIRGSQEIPRKFRQHYTKVLCLSHHSAPLAALEEESLMWAPYAYNINANEKATPFIREAKDGEERTRFLRSKNTTQGDIRGSPDALLEKILQEHVGDYRQNHDISLADNVWQLRQKLLQAS